MLPDILLISDNSKLQQEITDILHEYDVDFCFEHEALNVCIHQPVLVVLIVQEKPGTSGLDLFANLRESRPGLLGFLIVDKATAAGLCPAAMDYGFSGMFSPPLAPDHVRKKITEAMESASRYGELPLGGTRVGRSVEYSSFPHYEYLINFITRHDVTTKHDALEELLNILSDQTAADILSVMLYDEDQGFLRIAASQGLPDEITERVKTKPGDRIAGRVFQERTPVILNQETQNDSDFAHLLNRPEILSAVCCPMIVQDKILGVLNISYSDGDIRFANSDVEILGTLAADAALLIDLIDIIDFQLQRLLEERSKEV